MTSPDKIKLQIVMSNDAYDVLYETGVLCADPTKIVSEDFRPAYEWIASRMKDRIGSAHGGHLDWPLWAWFIRDGEDEIDPNSDEFDGLDCWLVTFEAKLDHVVLSDFENWHYVLNQHYLPDVTKCSDEQEKESDEFDRALEEAGIDWFLRPYPKPYWDKMLDSWERVFQITSRAKSVQATFWALSVDQVLEVTPCYGNPRGRQQLRSA